MSDLLFGASQAAIGQPLLTGLLDAIQLIAGAGAVLLRADDAAIAPLLVGTLPADLRHLVDSCETDAAALPCQHRTRRLTVPDRGGGEQALTLFFTDASAAGAEQASAMTALIEALAGTLAEMRRVAATLSGLTTAVDLLSIGLVLLAEDEAITFANATARRLLKGGRGLRLNAGRIGGDTLDDTLKWRDVFHAVLSAGQGRTAFLPIGSGFADPIIAVVARSPHGSGFVLWLVDPYAENRTALGASAALLGLTAKERDLAVQLACGASMATICDALAITSGTARSYLRNIFSKTGCTSQSELIVKLLRASSPFMLDQHELIRC